MNTQVWPTTWPLVSLSAGSSGLYKSRQKGRCVDCPSGRVGFVSTSCRMSNVTHCRGASRVAKVPVHRLEEDGGRTSMLCYHGIFAAAKAWEQSLSSR